MYWCDKERLFCVKSSEQGTMSRKRRRIQKGNEITKLASIQVVIK